MLVVAHFDGTAIDFVYARLIGQIAPITGLDFFLQRLRNNGCHRHIRPIQRKRQVIVSVRIGDPVGPIPVIHIMTDRREDDLQRHIGQNGYVRPIHKVPFSPQIQICLFPKAHIKGYVRERERRHRHLVNIGLSELFDHLRFKMKDIPSMHSKYSVVNGIINFFGNEACVGRSLFKGQFAYIFVILFHDQPGYLIKLLQRRHSIGNVTSEVVYKLFDIGSRMPVPFRMVS